MLMSRVELYNPLTIQKYGKLLEMLKTETLQADLVKLKDWSDEWLLKFNAK